MTLIPQDLRLRLLTGFAVLIILSPLRHAGPACAALLAVVALFALSGQALPWRRLWHLEGFLILLLLTLPFTLPGDPLFTVGPLQASAEGLTRAGVIAGKVAASVLLLALLFARVEMAPLGVALRALHLPDALVRLLVGVGRYLGVIRAEALRLHDAMRLRSFRPRSNRHTWRSYGQMGGMLILRSMQRADRVEEAMRLRGYAGRFLVVPMPAPTTHDWLASLWMIAGAGLILGWDLA